MTFTAIDGAPVIATTHDGRQLVVIDPEDREQVERLLRAYVLAGTSQTTETQDMQAALRSLITPPKPDEPQGLGAVVEDDHRMVYVRTEVTDPGDPPWFYNASEEAAGHFHYEDIPVVRVLSEGWSE